MNARAICVADHREIAGVVVPHRIESEWYTRNRLMKVKSVEVNAPIDDALFRMPFPPGMGPLRSLVGSWSVRIAQRATPDAEWQDSRRGSTIVAKLGGGMLEESFRTDSGIEVVRTFSFDQFNETYRVTQIDSRRV